MDKDEALNTLAKVFHNGEEMEGEDGAVMVVDLALWNEGCEAIEAVIGGEEDEEVGAGETAVTRKMIGAAHGIMLARGDFVLSAELLERIYLAMDAAR
jgi:hypothetical protein